MPLSTLLGLILCNLIWSAHPLMGKLLLQDFSPAQGAWLRYVSALATFLICLIASRVFGRFTKRGADGWRSALMPQAPLGDWAWIGLMGIGAFAFSPLLQMTGLAASRATDNSVIIAIEPLLSVVLAWAFLRERISVVTRISLIVAFFGFLLLSGFRYGELSRLDAHSWGDLLLLTSLLGEAGYSVLGRKLVGKYSPAALFGHALGIGTVVLTLAVLPLEGLPHIHALHWKSAMALLWLGPLGTGFTYFYWILALVRVPVSTIALTLFIQPLLGSIWGYGFLSERLSVVQAMGGILILIAVFSQSWLERGSRPTESPSPATPLT